MQNNLHSQLEALVAAFQAGRVDEARRGAEAVLARHPGEPTSAQVMGMLLMREDRNEEAVKLLRAGERNAPTDPRLLNTLAVALKQSGDREAAREVLKKAMAADKTYVDAPLNLANLDVEDDNRDAARALFNTALKLQPGHPQALFGLARIALIESDAEAAFRFSEQALRSVPNFASALMSKAEALLILKRYDEAITTAKQITLAPGASPSMKALAFGYQAEAADKQGKYGEAHSLFVRTNTMLTEINKSLMDAPPSPYNPITVKRLQAYMARVPAPDDAPAGLTGPAPAFLMGFPRSGTTLLEQVLLAHPKIETLEEQEALQDAHDDLLTGVDGLLKLATLTTEEAQHYRDAYWARVEKLGKAAPTDGVFVDKLPLATMHLPLIAKIFPDAKILFALRDPRDVVLSCYHQRFGMTQAMFQFLDLQTSATYYDLVMNVGVEARTRYPLQAHDVRYESVVDDLESAARAAISFLGVEWDEGVLNYREATKARRINTPSLTQVIEPIYKTSKGKWQNYETAMAPVLDLLAPWVKRFGYGE